MVTGLVAPINGRDHRLLRRSAAPTAPSPRPHAAGAGSPHGQVPRLRRPRFDHLTCPPRLTSDLDQFLGGRSHSRVHMATSRKRRQDQGTCPSRVRVSRILRSCQSGATEASARTSSSRTWESMNNPAEIGVVLVGTLEEDFILQVRRPVVGGQRLADRHVRLLERRPGLMMAPPR